jgi:hypothetical protein
VDNEGGRVLHGELSVRPGIHDRPPVGVFDLGHVEHVPVEVVALSRAVHTSFRFHCKMATSEYIQLKP